MLIEIFITVFIISIALVALVGVFPKVAELNNLSARHTVAANLAQQAIEALKARDAHLWDAIEEKTEIDFSEHSQSIAARQIINQTEYSLQGTAEPHRSLSDDIVVAIITVSYTDSGKRQSQQYVTYFTKYAY